METVTVMVESVMMLTYDGRVKDSSFYSVIVQ